MTVPHILTSKEEFARSAAWRREQDRFARDVEQRRKDRREADHAEDEFLEFAASAIMATVDDIEQLRMTLDRLDAANVEALMQNRIALDKSRERIETMLGPAYTLPDGRRVFKTKDGLRVFDENGVELGHEDIDPDLIEDWRPDYESFAAEKAAMQALLEERAELEEFQNRIDAARERLDDDDLTKQDIADIEVDLESNAPLAVQQLLPDYDEKAAITPTRDFAAAASPSVIAVPDLSQDLQHFTR